MQQGILSIAILSQMRFRLEQSRSLFPGSN